MNGKIYLKKQNKKTQKISKTDLLVFCVSLYKVSILVLLYCLAFYYNLSVLEKLVGQYDDHEIVHVSHTTIDKIHQAPYCKKAISS